MLGRVPGEQPDHLVPALHRPQPRRFAVAAAVRPDRDVRREDLHQRGDVPVERGPHEPLRRLPPHPRMRPVPRPARVHVFPGAPGQLPYGRRGAVEDSGDLGVRVAEDLVQHEHRPLQRGQRLQHHQHRQGDGLGAQGRIVRAVVGGDQGFGQPGADVGLLAAADRGAAAQRVVDGRPDEVRPWVGDLLQRLAAAPGRPGQPGLLEDVLGVGDAAEHVVDDAEQQLAMGEEVFGRLVQPVVGVGKRDLGHSGASAAVRSPLGGVEGAGL